MLNIRKQEIEEESNGTNNINYESVKWKESMGLKRNKEIRTKKQDIAMSVRVFRFFKRNVPALSVDWSRTFFQYFLFCILYTSCTKRSSNFDDSQVFRYNQHANLTTLDPAFAKDLRTIWATAQLFNGLVQLDDGLHVQPCIAKSWTISEDGKSYEFILRNDVRFHKHVLFGKDSTRKVVAKDFEYSFQRLLDPEIASPGKWVLGYVDNFNAKNDSTFVIHLKKFISSFFKHIKYAILFCCS